MLIGMHGKKLAGKDTAYQRLHSIYGDQVERRSFADLLYESAAAALGVTVHQLYAWKVDPSVEIQVVDLPLDHPDYATLKPRVRAKLSVREYLQRYGTESHRQVFGDNFWVDQVDLEHDSKIVVVTDVRFFNEAQKIRDEGGVVVRVTGPLEVEEAGDTHASEEPLPAAMVDYVLENDRRDDNYQWLDYQLGALLNRTARGDGERVWRRLLGDLGFFD